jgi:hypothetical protein
MQVQMLLITHFPPVFHHSVPLRFKKRDQIVIENEQITRTTTYVKVKRIAIFQSICTPLYSILYIIVLYILF